MKLKHVFRGILPYAVTNWYLKEKQAKSSFEKFKERFVSCSHLLEDSGRFVCEWKDKLPCLNDKTGQTHFDAHYIYHPAWAARILASTKPQQHVDISSSLHFVTLVSSFIPIKFYDYRPADLDLSNLMCNKADLLQLPFEDDSVESISCMHVVEHIGLERYGDLFDPQGDLKAMRELSRVVAKGGVLLMVVPIGGQSKIQYNAHRIYRYKDIIEEFSSFDVQEFSLITDASQFICNATEEDADLQEYGCGCFYFIKR